ncbi:MAG: hypothetical protein K8T89_25380 [Planctomycetes bacterium]|nr:hypothetical protein [Planctomycetota bacterium]
MRFSCHLVAVFVVLVALAVGSSHSDDSSKQSTEKGTPPKKLPSEAEIMAAKLKYAQNLLGAITQEDFKKIEDNATALVKISEGAEILNARKTEEYLLQAKMFRQTLTKMAAKAQDRNIDGVRLTYLDLTGSCFKCHDYTRKNQRN